MIEKLKKMWISYKSKYIEPPIREKYIELKEKDKSIYEQRVVKEVNKMVVRQYILPAVIISIFSIYSIFYYINELIVYLGGI